ncbi:MAG TPA: pilus assembly protein TadG-related protein [Pirellulaceae bacterium]|jgi:hypothetical protein|nr:pilus assembly protein TadG-related protein [Pirellulaceae bacterium]
MTRSNRRGNIVVLTAVGLVLILGMVAFAVDTGYMLVVKSQAQVAADAAALAAGGEMCDILMAQRKNLREDKALAQVREEARKYCAKHRVGGKKGFLVPEEDVTIGRLVDHCDLNEDPKPCPLSEANAIRVTVRRDADRGGAIPLFFARVLGRYDFEVEATATVLVAQRVVGVRPTPDHPNGPLFPYTFKEQEWRSALDGLTGMDEWTYDAKTGKVHPGPDGVPEFSFFPIETSKGNFGSIDLGGSNNATPDLKRQIVHGVNEQDLADFGGEFVLDDTGSLYVNGDTGLSLAVEPDMQAILGEPRLMPLYASYEGTGNRTMYRIVGFAGIRLMEVQLKGGDKFILAQPAIVNDPSVVTGSAGTQSDYAVFAPKLVK